MTFRKYRLFWLNGETEIIRGLSCEHAFTRAGYTTGALRALDYYKEVRTYGN